MSIKRKVGDNGEPKLRVKHSLPLEVRNFTSDASSWKDNCVLRVSQFGVDALEKLFAVADEMRDIVARGGGDTRAKGKIIGTLFYENSTRTTSSLQAAMLRLGGSVISVSEATSSIKKGETLQDTIRALANYVDVIALRHPTEGAAQEAAAVTTRPLINAGDGVGEHPTQALLDLYTIISELGSVEGKVITMMGDLKHGRTVHSLTKLLSLFKCELVMVSPPSLRMPQYVTDAVTAASGGSTWSEHTAADSLEEVITKTDVLYVTRIQKERFAVAEDYDAVKDFYVVNPELLERAKKTMILMHPLPRVGEISESCDSDPRAAYFRQMENGMYVRMALMSLLLGTST